MENEFLAMMEGMHTALPGRIVQYDHKKRRATVAQDISRRMSDGSEMLPPEIYDVPVTWPVTCGGKCMIVAPMAPGDKVLLVFSQRSIEGWKSGDSSAPSDPRWHDMSDCFAIPAGGHQDVETDGKSIHVKNGATELVVSESGVEIRGDIKVTGNISQAGSLTATGDILGAGVSLSMHKHKGVETGNGETQAPSK